MVVQMMVLCLADNGTSDGALLGHGTVDVLLGSTDGAPASAGGADSILLDIDPGIVDNTADGTVIGIEAGHPRVLQMVQCLAWSLVQ